MMANKDIVKAITDIVTGKYHFPKKENSVKEEIKEMYADDIVAEDEEGFVVDACGNKYRVNIRKEA